MILYLVEAEFESYGTYYRLPLGIFDTEEVAIFNENKWSIFFKTKKKEIFSKYDAPEYRDSDGDIKEEYETEYYTDQRKFGDILNFESAYVRKFELNLPLLPSGGSSVYSTSNSDYIEMSNKWNIEWERDFKITNIIKNDK